MSADQPKSPETAKETGIHPRLSKPARIMVWLGGATLGVIIVALFIVLAVPSQVARFTIEDQLDQLGIDHDGVGTVIVDLWNSKVSAGPIGFRSQDAEPGQIAEAGFRYSLEQLLDGRALVKAFFIRGFEMEIKRHEDGSITFNGIPLEQLAAGTGSQAPDAAATQEGEATFGAGIDSFEFTDSLLVFEDLSGGSLTFQVDRLLLSDVVTWDPKSPVALELDGSLNDIAVRWRGTAHPFAEPVTMTLESRLSDATIEKIARFVGETGLVRQEGVIATDVLYDFAFHADGLVEAKMDGTYSVEGLAIESADGITAALERAVLTIGLEQRVEPDTTTTVTGAIALETTPLSMENGTGGTMELGEIAFGIDEMHFKKSPQTREIGTVLAAAKARIHQSEQTPTVIGLLVATVRDIVINALEHQVELDGKPRLAIKGGTLAQPDAELTFEDLAINLGTLDSTTLERGAGATASLEIALKALAASNPALALSTADTTVTSQNIELKRLGSETSLAFDLTTRLQDTRLAPADGGELALGLLEFGTAGIKVAGEDGKGRLTGPLTLALEGLGAKLPAEGGELSFEGQAVRLELPEVVLDGEEALVATLSGALTADMLGVTLPDEGKLALSRLEFGTTGIEIAEQDGSGRLTGPLALTLEGLGGTLPAEGGELTLEGDALKLDLPEFTLDGEEALAASLSGALKTDKLGVTLAGEAPLAVALGTGELAIKGVRIEPNAGEPNIDGALAGALSDLSITLEGEGVRLATARIGAQTNQLSAKLSDPPALEMAGEVTVGGLEAKAPFAEGDSLTAKIAETKLSLPSLSVEGDSLQAAAEVESTKLALTISEQSPQQIDLEALRVTGIKADPKKAIEIDTVALEGLLVSLNQGIVELGGAGGEAPKSEPEAEYLPTRLGKITISPGSKVRFTDDTIDPKMELEIVVEKAAVGPIDTGQPATKTDIDLGLAVNEDSLVKVNGWASPLATTPDFELATALERLSLPPFSPYASDMVGMNVDSGALTADLAAAAMGGALDGKIDVLVEDLYLEPLSDEDSKSFEEDFGVPVNFAVGILKNDKGQIDLGFPLSGTLEEPQLDYSEAISKAIAGAAAAILPTSWFGDDGRSFEIQPVTFAPGTTEITEEGASSADKIAELLNGKPQLTIRLCGRAAAADLIAFRGGELPEAEPVEGEEPEAKAAAEPEALAKPTDQEADQLLALAEQRRQVVQTYLIDSHGIDKAKIFECRSSYSTEGSKPPRAEFRL